MNFFISALAKYLHLRGAWNRLMYCPHLHITVRRRYREVMNRITQNRKSGKPIRVIFVVDNVSKWKCQSVYDLMKKSSTYEPLIALSVANTNLSLTNIPQKLHSDRLFYEARGCHCVDACDFASGACLSLSKYEPDIVFFQEPWGSEGAHSVEAISKYALTCYIPYACGYDIFDVKQLEFVEGFHDRIWLHFLLNEDSQKSFCSRHSTLKRISHVIGAGNTMLDEITYTSNVANDGSVIYAPHFSFQSKNLNLAVHVSTFHWSGLPVLKFAQQHPEIKWIFKPHPGLKSTLITSKFMTQAEADGYYKAWEAVGTACYDGNYIPLFERSSALITDCCSFLAEYAATGKPIIRLVPKEIDIFPHPYMQDFFDSLYQIDDLSDLYDSLNQIILTGKDPKKDRRRTICEKLNLSKGTAAAKIMEHINSSLGLP